MPTPIDELPHQCEELTSEPSSAQVSQRERARRRLADELAPECPAGEPVQELLLVPDPAAPSAAAGAVGRNTGRTDAIWENYSRRELWEMYAATNETAQTRGTEVARLKGFSVAQDALAKNNLQAATNEYNRMCALYQQQLRAWFASQQVTLRQSYETNLAAALTKAEAKLTAAVASAKAHADTRIRDAETQTSRAEADRNNAKSDRNHLIGICVIGVVLYFCTFIYGKFF